MKDYQYVMIVGLFYGLYANLYIITSFLTEGLLSIGCIFLAFVWLIIMIHWWFINVRNMRKR